MKLLEHRSSDCKRPLCLEKIGSMRRREPISVIVFSNRKSESTLRGPNMNYVDSSTPVQIGQRVSKDCRYCGTRYEYGCSIHNGVVSINADDIREGVVQYLNVSTHKYVHVDIADDLYQAVVSGGESFLKAAESFNRSRCQTLEEKIRPSSSGLMSISKCQHLLPEMYSNIGVAGVRPFLEAKDVEACFFLWAALMRTWRRMRSSLCFPKTSRENDVPMYGLVQVLLEDFKRDGVFMSRHACTDCSFVSKAPNSAQLGSAESDLPARQFSGSAKIVQAAVIDGVTCTTPVCAMKGCCAELSNQRTHRFCESHFQRHGLCGVVSGPGMNDRCQELVEGISSLSSFRFPTPPKRVSCRNHAHVENAWRQIEEDKPDFIVRLRAARSRGRKRKQESTRLVDPENSDHCKGDWEAASERKPSIQTIEEYTVDFRKKYAYVYCVICRPCGMVVDGRFFADSESPTEVANFVLDTFSEKGSMPNVLLFDAACKISKSIYSSNGKLKHLRESFSNSVWLVPPIHQQSHKQSDVFCQKNCRVSSFRSFLSPSLEQRWNGTACEQLFSWLGRREPTIRSMKKSVADVFFLILLDHSNVYQDAERMAKAFKVHDETGARVLKRRKSTLIPRQKGLSK